MIGRSAVSHLQKIEFTMSEIPISAVATVQERLSVLTYRIALPNGKRVVGHLAHSLRENPPDFEAQAKVSVELTPYDFSKARIVGRAEKA